MPPRIWNQTSYPQNDGFYSNTIYWYVWNRWFRFITLYFYTINMWLQSVISAYLYTVHRLTSRLPTCFSLWRINALVSLRKTFDPNIPFEPNIHASFQETGWQSFRLKSMRSWTLNKFHSVILILLRPYKFMYRYIIENLKMKATNTGPYQNSESCYIKKRPFKIWTEVDLWGHLRSHDLKIVLKCEQIISYKNSTDSYLN